ncbi:MAG: hypothetical protein ACPKNR_02790 [Pleomorphochaeta sp.]
MENIIKLKLNKQDGNNEFNITIYKNDAKVLVFDSGEQKISSLDVYNILRINKGETLRLEFEPKQNNCKYFDYIVELFKDLVAKINLITN